MNDWQTDEITALLLRAATVALRHGRQPRARRKADGTVVTVADVQIERLLARHLHQPERGRFLLGEESAGAWCADRRQFRDAWRQSLFIVDPIDGTAPYVNRLPSWGISLGYARAGRLTEGAICLPATGELFISAGPAVWYLRLAAGRVLSRRRLRPPARRFTRFGMVAVTQELLKQGRLRLDQPVQALGSAVVALTNLLQGHYVAYLGRIRLWDLAGGLPLLFKLGLHATQADGRPLGAELSDTCYVLPPRTAERWRLRQPVVFGVPGAARRLLPVLANF